MKQSDPYHQHHPTLIPSSLFILPKSQYSTYPRLNGTKRDSLKPSSLVTRKKETRNTHALKKKGRDEPSLKSRKNTRNHGRIRSHPGQCRVEDVAMVVVVVYRRSEGG